MSWELKDKNNLPFEDNIDYSKFFFYTDPTVNADNFAINIDEQQKKDLKLCVQAENILNRYLNREHGEVMKDASYLGFESNSFCYHPAQYKWYFNDKVQNTTKIDFVNAEQSNTTYREPYQVTETSWFKGQKNSTRPFFSNIYKFAGTNKLGLTFCVPINNREGNFMAALCTDQEINSEAYNWNTNRNYM